MAVSPPLRRRRVGRGWSVPARPVVPTLPDGSTGAAMVRRQAGRRTPTPSVSVLPSCASPARLAHCLDLFQRAARTDRNARKRRLGDVDRDMGLLPDAMIEALKQGPAAGEH